MGRKTLEERYPSLELIYNQVKDILQHQGRVYDSFNVRATFLWGSATVVLVVFLSIIQDLSLSSLAYIGALYLLITILCWLVIAPKKIYGTATDFNVLKEELAILSPPEFMVEMINHIEKAYGKNRRWMIIQSWAITISGGALIAMMSLLLYWVFKFYPYLGT